MAWDGVERRRYKRYTLTYFTGVFQNNAGETRRGIVLSARKPIPYREVVVTPTEPEKGTSPIDHRGKAGR